MKNLQVAFTPGQHADLTPSSAAEHISQVQRLSSNNVPPNLGQGFLELLLQLLVSHHFGSLSHLPQRLLESSEDPDQAAFVHIRHFAGIVY
jgi:hypothetical protein